MSEIKFFLCGGTGINIGLCLKDKPRTEMVKNAAYVGIDASEANKAKDLFPVEHMPDAEDPTKFARGSGKVKGRNYPQAQSFVEQVLSRHKPANYNIIVCNTSGGSGNMLGTLLARELIKAGHPVVMALVSDFTSTVEMSNSVGSLTSLHNQTLPNVLGAVIPFLHVANTTEKTRGEVNDELVDKLNLLSLFLTESNEEMDYEDVKNLLNYSKHYNVPAALSQIRFFDQTSLKSFEGKPPVAVASLYCSADEIIPRFEGSHVRTTGVFSKSATLPRDTTELHMVLDHGDYLKELEAHSGVLDDRKVEAKATYVQQKDLSAGADSNGLVF